MPHVYIDLDELNDHVLINELETRGYEVLEEDHIYNKELTDEEKDWICEKIINYVDLLDPMAISIYEKVKK